MTMKESIERAIYAATPRNKPFDLLPAIARRQYTKEAEAVLDALREPTEGMLAAGCEIGPDTNRGPFDYDSALDVFTAMIDAAKAEDAT